MNEFINKTEIQGIAGQMRIDTVNGIRKASFVVMLEDVRHTASGITIVNTWLTATATESPERPIDSLARGRFVNIKGRLTNRTFGDGHGGTRTVTDIEAESLSFPNP